MRNIKDFQARYDRWKSGERYWDIRGVDLPKYDDADKNTNVETPQYYYNVFPSAIGAKNLEVTTPDIVVTADYPKIENQIHNIYDNIANGIVNGIDGTMNAAIGIPTQAILGTGYALHNIFGSLNKPHVRTWRDTPNNYIDTGYSSLETNPVTGRVEKFPDGEVNRNFKRSVLGDIGLVSGDDGTWRYYDESGNLVKQCAKFANKYSSIIGRPTAGDAWTTRGIFGDSILYNRSLFGLPDSTAQNLQNGDIVDLIWDKSPSARKAKQYGRGNSHTGRIFKPNKTDTYVIHEVGGKVKIEPLAKFDKYMSRHFYLNQIRRPFTQKESYEKEK